MLDFSSWKVILPILLVLAIGSIFAIMEVRLKLADAERDKATAQLTILMSQVSDQNAAILSMQQKTKALQNNLNTAEKNASNQAKYDKKVIVQISKAKVPVDCQKATAWGAAYASKIARAWV